MNISQNLPTLAPTWARGAIEAFAQNRQVEGQTGQIPTEEDTFMSSSLIEITATAVAKLDNGPEDLNPERGIVERDRAGQPETTYIQQGREDFRALIVDGDNVSLIHNGVNSSSLISLEKGNPNPLVAIFLDHNDASNSLVFDAPL